MRRFCGRRITLIALVSVLVHLLAPAALAAATEVKIPGGTTIVLAFENALHPESTQIGEKVYMSVVTAVTVDRETVVEGGARAVAEVTHSQKKGGIGKPAVISIMARSVEAVDGTMIPISGVKHIEGENKQTEALLVTILCCVLGLFMQGGDAEIPEGSNLQATIDVTTVIEIAMTEDATEGKEAPAEVESPAENEAPAEVESPAEDEAPIEEELPGDR